LRLNPFKCQFKIVALMGSALLLAGCDTLTMPGAAPSVKPDAQADAFSTYLSARHAAQQHDMTEAARYYAQSLKTDPGNADLLSLAFFYSSTAGDLNSAAQYAAKVVQTAPDDRAARLALAVAAFHNKDYAGVRKNLAASAKGPFSVLTVSLFDAWAAAAAGDQAGVAADMKTLGDQSAAEGVAAFHGALIADFQNKDADALYAKAMLLNANSPRVAEAYGRYLERKGRTADATKFYNGLIKSTAVSPVAAQGLARLAKNQKPEPMIRSAEDGAAEGLFGIAASLSDASSADVSILYLRMALYLRPDLALAQILLADRYETLQKYDDAVAIYAKVDKSSPYYRMAAVEAARNQSRMDHNDLALRDLKTLADGDAKDSSTWIALGDAYRGANKFNEAVTAYNQAEKAIGTPAKKDWPLFYARAMAEDRAGNWDKAEADVNLGLKLSPDQPELLNYLAYSWVDQGRKFPEALAMLEKARTLRPYDGYIVDSVGWAYYRLGRYEDAAQTLEAAVLLVPGDPTINDHLGDALWKAGRRMEARYQWDHALNFGPENAEKAQIEQKLKSGLTS
jgi:tetratricopeptide (TPR) repeat protein